MPKYFRLILITLTLMLLTAPAFAKEYRFTMATTNGHKDFSSLVMSKWGETLKERSNGQLLMEFMPDGTLGNDQQLLQQVATDEIQLNIAGPIIVHQLLQEYQCLDAEFVFRDEHHGLRVWNGAVGKEVSDALKAKYGMVIMGVALRGARQLTSNVPVKEPADLKGVKVRVTNPLRSEIFAAYGALPGPLPVSELYGGLRSGVFDAQENPIPTIYASRWHEVQKYINLTGHVYSYNVVTANASFIDNLPAELRKLMEDTLTEALQELNAMVEKETENILAKMQEETGIQVIQPNVQAFRDIALPIVSKFASSRCRPGLLEDIEATK